VHDNLEQYVLYQQNDIRSFVISWFSSCKAVVRVVYIGYWCDATWRPSTPCRDDRRTTSKRSVMSRWSRNTDTLGGGNPPAATHRTCGRGDPATNVSACRWRSPPPPRLSSTSVSGVWTPDDVELLSVVMYNRLIGAVQAVASPTAVGQLLYQTRRIQHSQGCTNPRRSCFWASWPGSSTFCSPNKWFLRTHGGTFLCQVWWS